MTQAETVRLQTRFSPVSSTVTADWIGYSFWKYRFFFWVWSMGLFKLSKIASELFWNSLGIVLDYLAIMLGFFFIFVKLFKILSRSFQILSKVFKILSKFFGNLSNCLEAVLESSNRFVFGSGWLRLAFQLDQNKVKLSAFDQTVRIGFRIDVPVVSYFKMTLDWDWIEFGFQTQQKKGTHTS